MEEAKPEINEPSSQTLPKPKNGPKLVSIICAILAVAGIADSVASWGNHFETSSNYSVI